MTVVTQVATLIDASQIATIRAINPGTQVGANNRSEAHGLFVVYLSLIGTDQTSIDEFDLTSGTIAAPSVTLTEVIGSTAMADISGNGRTGTYQTPTNTYFQNHGLIPGGSSVIILLGNVVFPVTLNLSAPWSFEMWVLGNQWVINATDGFSIFELFQDDTAGRQWIITDSNFPKLSTPVGSYPSIVNATHHIVLVHTGGGNVQIWQDGVLKASGPVGFAGSPGSSSIFTVGAINLPVTFDELAVYNYALSATRIAAHYSARGSLTSYTAAVLADSPANLYPMDDTGPLTPDYGGAHIINNQLVVNRALLQSGVGSLGDGTWGFTVFDDLKTLANPVFHPFTDLPSTFAASRGFYDFEAMQYTLPYKTDGTYCYIRNYPDMRKYLPTGGNAVEVFPFPHTRPDYEHVNPETWQFDKDGKNIYIATAGRITGGAFSSGVYYGPLRGPWTLWLNTSDIPLSDVRIQCAVDAISVDNVSGHVFLFWDNFQEELPIFIDEHLPDGTFVTRWIPRTSQAPTPRLGFPWSAIPEYAGYPLTQGITMCPAMDVRNGILYVNFDLYWNAGFGGGTAGRLEDAIWKIDTTSPDRAGESEYYVRTQKLSAYDRSRTFTISPIMSLCVGGAAAHGIAETGGQIAKLDTRKPI